ncbi:hypothetical protein ACROYT_G035971 [Oculina patagonica]
MLSPRPVLGKNCCFQNESRTWQLLYRLLHGTKSRDQKFPGQWLSKASNVIYIKSENVVRYSYEKIGGFVQSFDDLLGISEVQEAQSSVKKAENEFMTTRGQVQSAKSALNSVQERLKEIRRKLDRIPRDDERYLGLATEEHKILVEEKRIKSEYENLEALERDQFAVLSGAVRDSHERERARAERTKHWSVIGSVGGAALGILGSTVVNYIRLKQIKNSIKETGNTLMEKTDELTDLVKAQDNQIGTQASELKESFSTQSKLLEQKLEELGSVLNFVTLNLASDPLKEFGIHIQPPVDAKSFAGGQSAVSQNQGNISDIMTSIASRIDSVIEVMKINQFNIQGDFQALQQYLKKLDSSVLQHEEKTQKELMKLAKCINDKSVLGSGHEDVLIPTNKFVENDQWWSKASTFTSVLCTILTAAVLMHEFYK